MNVKSVIAQLGQISFHDLPVANFSWQLGETPRMVLTLMPFVEATQSYGTLVLTFEGVTRFEAGALSFPATPDLELAHFDYAYEDGFACELVFLTGFGGPSWTWRFLCVEIGLQRI